MFITARHLFPQNPKRLLILCGLLVLIAAGDFFYRRWRPAIETSTAHFLIHSSATAEQTEKVGRTVEILYSAYVKVFTNSVQAGGSKMQLRLYKDRKEIRRVHRGMGWAEAFYREPYCNAYYSTEEGNPYHWMLHEATHQLNNEVSYFKIPKWVNEGTATYFSTSLVLKGELVPGRIDPRTYPVWWLSTLKLSGNRTNDIAHTQFIPLRAILTGIGGPGMSDNFNLYYVCWWSLSHFLFHADGGKYRAGYLRVIQEGGTLESFERNIGLVDTLEQEWYEYLRELQRKN